jgi:phage terminase large subunit
MTRKTVDITFAPANEKQRQFIESTHKFVLNSGAVSTGKSYLGCWKGFMLSLLYPGNRGLICRKELSSLKASTLVTLLEKVIPPEMIRSFDKQEMVLKLYTNVPSVYSTIVFSGLDKGADQQYPTKIGSTEYGWIFVDEASELSEDDWQMLATRLRYRLAETAFGRFRSYIGFHDKYAEFHAKMVRQLFAATNPEGPNHHLYKFFFENKADDRLLIQTTPYDNPYNPPEYLKLLEDTLTGIRRERLLFGKWVQAEGVIYKSFDYLKHVRPVILSTEFQSFKHFFAGADSNFPLPRAGAIFGIKGNGEVILLDEFYKENSPVEELAQWFSDFAKHYSITLTVYHDPSDPEAIVTLNKMQGLRCDKALNSVNPGISQVATLLEQGKLFINSSCVNAIKFFQSYRWKAGTQDMPEKRDDHLMDAIRYGIFTHTAKPRAAPMMVEFI